MTELNWYESGSSRIDYSPLIEKVWKKYSDNGKNVQSAYGQYIFPERVNTKEEGLMSQWDWIKKVLIFDKDSRRELININGEKNKEIINTNDFPCTISLQFLIRNNKLHLITHMRSNDIFFGFRNDLYTFTKLQMRMCRELSVYYNDLTLGQYTHIVNSMHLYEEQFEKVKDLIETE
jgi:thymidylate synthase